MRYSIIEVRILVAFLTYILQSGDRNQR